MKKSLLLAIAITCINLSCFCQNMNNSEVIKKCIISFLHWHKNDEADTAKRDFSILKGGSPDTTTKVRIDKDGVEVYLNTLRSTRLLSDTYLNNLRQYFYAIDVNLEATPKTPDLIAINGLNSDILLHTQEPELILDYIDNGIFEKISVIQNKAIVQFYIPKYRITMIFTLTMAENAWMIDDIGSTYRISQ